MKWEVFNYVAGFCSEVADIHCCRDFCFVFSLHGIQAYSRRKTRERKSKDKRQKGGYLIMGANFVQNWPAYLLLAGFITFIVFAAINSRREEKINREGQDKEKTKDKKEG